jgi:hypothetical protein
MKTKALLYGDKIPHTIDISSAFHGLEEMDAEITISDKWLNQDGEYFKQFDVCVSGVFDCRFALTKMGKRNFDIVCYPDDLTRFYGRKIEKYKLLDVVKNKMKNKFIKPVFPKRFEAFVMSQDSQMLNIISLDEEELVYVSDIVKFESEWRVYVDENEIRVICNYKGDPCLFPNIDIISWMIKLYNGPCCYALDVGIVGEKTLLVEVNDFYSIGNYGLFPQKYVEMLIKRWKELVD